MSDSLAIQNCETTSGKNYGPTVQEQQIDFLLEEEFSVNLDFLKCFVELAKRLETPVSLVRVERSVSDAFGEADLIVIYKDRSGKEIGILVEDKINAAFQPKQADRYLLRGGTSESNGWNSFWTCLVAPEAYIRRGHGFQAAVSLESIQDWFKGTGGDRGQFKATIVQKAIVKERNTGVQRVDPHVTEFRRRQYECCKDFFKEIWHDIELRKPADSWSGETWFDVRSQLLPHGVYIRHQAEAGRVLLSFPNTTVACLRSIDPLLEEKMSIVPTGKSSSVLLQVAPIRRFDNFDQVRDLVLEGLEAVRRLLEFFHRQGDQIRSALNAYREAQRQPSGSPTLNETIAKWVQTPTRTGDRGDDIVLELAFEGGSIILQKYRVEERYAFRVQTDELALLDDDLTGISAQSGSAPIASFQLALQELDRHPSWVNARPLRIHGDYRDAVIAAVCERLVGTRSL